MSRRSELAEVVDDFLAAKCGQAVVSAAEAAGDAPELWQQVAELGWTLATLPESEGGSEVSFADACGIVRVAASHAAPLPLGDTSLIAAWMLHAAGLSVPSGQLAVAPATPGERIEARRAGDGWTLHGRLEAVPWAPTAAALVVLAEAETGERLVAAVDPDGSVRPRRTNLAGEPRADVLLDGAAPAAERIAPAPAFLDAGAVLARGALVRAVMLLGALERIRDLTISYARDRRQFGRSIGRFQAVGHQLAHVARDVALARAAVESAIDATREDAAPPAAEVAIAKIAVGRAATAVPRRAHQVHGAIGVTEEYLLQQYTRRAWAWRDEFGSERHWAQVLTATATHADGGMWELISSTRPARAA